MRWSADSFAPKDHARGVNMGDPRRFRLHVQRGNSGGLFRMDLPTQSWRASWLAAGDRLIKALGISSHSRGSGCSQVDLDPRPTPFDTSCDIRCVRRTTLYHAHSFTAESLSSQYPSGPTRPWRVSGARMLSSPPAHLGHGEHGSVRGIIPCVVDRRLRLRG